MNPGDLGLSTRKEFQRRVPNPERGPPANRCCLRAWVLEIAGYALKKSSPGPN